MAAQDRAVILYRPGRLSWQRQITVAMQWTHQHIPPRPYLLVSLAYLPDDALALVQMGLASVVVAVFYSADDEELDAKLRAADGRLEYVRERPARLPRESALDTHDLVIAAARRRLAPDKIAALLGVPIERVRLILARFRQPRPPQ